jgi:putative phosphoesterase
LKVAVLSDIHGNHYALQEVLNAAQKSNVKKLLILGDIVGYYYHPDKVMAMLRDWDYEFVKGNHEKIMEQLIGGSIEMEAIKKKYGSGHQSAIEKLSPQQFNELVNAPEKMEVTIGGTNFLICHGSNWDADYYLYPDAPADVLGKCNETGVDFVLVGHSHYAFAYRNYNSTLINVGSVGQSRSMGGVANWAIINTENKCFELRSTNYSVGMLINEIEQIDPDIPYLKNILKRNNH